MVVIVVDDVDVVDVGSIALFAASTSMSKFLETASGSSVAS